MRLAARDQTVPNSPYPQDARSLAQMLDDASLNVVHVRGLKDAASKLETGNFQVVVTEANLGDGTWLDLLRVARDPERTGIQGRVSSSDKSAAISLPSLRPCCGFCGTYPWPAELTPWSVDPLGPRETLDLHIGGRIFGTVAQGMPGSVSG